MPRPDKSLTVFIVVTHLLGVGHLSRMAALARALSEAGHQVTLVSGGRSVPTLRADGISLVQLPPVHCEGTNFSRLLGPDGQEIDDDYRTTRIGHLLAAFEAARPDVIVTELFPMGRRQLAAEFETLLRAAHARDERPAILCSIRDILNPPAKSTRAAEALQRLGAFYDGVLVHGDKALAPLAASWPVVSALERRLDYTGYIAETAMPDGGPGTGEDEIIVSGGGSAASLPLFRVALVAAALVGPERRWRILVGHAVDAADFAALCEAAPDHVTVERARSDFRALLARCALSVSQAGYNTVVEFAQASVRAVVVPFEAGREQEQALRAACFAKAGLLTVVSEADLGPAVLADAVRNALAAPPPQAATVNLGGLAASIRSIECAAKRRAREQDADRQLQSALDALAQSGRTWRLWWRDDDATQPTPALDRLLALARRYELPLSLAVIPASVTQDLADRLANEPGVFVLQHGWSHTNGAAKGAKKCEMLADDKSLPGRLRDGQFRLQGLFGTRVLPVLVPPWNRIDSELVARLPDLGFTGLSTYKAAPAHQAAPGLVQVNTHWDPIAWKSDGGLLDPAELTLALAHHAMDLAHGHGEQTEPFGLLTHHLVHDEWIWRYLENILSRLSGHKSVAFLAAPEAFQEFGAGKTCSTGQ